MTTLPDDILHDPTELQRVLVHYGMQAFDNALASEEAAATGREAIERNMRERMLRSIAMTLHIEHTLRVVLPFEDLDDLQNASDELADILCWAAGFRAATPDNLTNWPPTDGVRNLRDRIRKAIEATRRRHAMGTAR